MKGRSFAQIPKGVNRLETILQAVGDVGFPVAVTAYLLVRLEGKVEALAANIAKLAEAVERNN